MNGYPNRMVWALVVCLLGTGSVAVGDDDPELDLTGGRQTIIGNATQRTSLLTGEVIQNLTHSTVPHEEDFDIPHLLTPEQQVAVPWALDFGANYTRQPFDFDVDFPALWRTQFGAGATIHGSGDVEQAHEATISLRGGERLMPRDPTNPGGQIPVTVEVAVHATLTPPAGPGRASIFVSGGLIEATDEPVFLPTLVLLQISNDGLPFIFKLGDVFDTDPNALSSNGAGMWTLETTFPIQTTVTEGELYDMRMMFNLTVINGAGNEVLGQVNAFNTVAFTLLSDNPNVSFVTIPESTGAILLGLCGMFGLYGSRTRRTTRQQPEHHKIV